MPADLSRWSSKEVLPVQWHALCCSFFYFVTGQNSACPGGTCRDVKFVAVAGGYAGIPFGVGKLPVTLQ